MLGYDITIADATATGTIVDNDEERIPRISFNPTYTSVVEGERARLKVVLDRISAIDTSFTYRVIDEAISIDDYTVVDLTSAIIPAGDSSFDIIVDTKVDLYRRCDKRFYSNYCRCRKCN